MLILIFHRALMVNSPNCMICGVKESNTHIFTECVLVREAWGWVRLRLLGLLSPGSAVCSNFEMINVMFDKHFMDMEAVWLVTTFLEYVWLEKYVKKNKVKIEHLIGFLKLRFKANQVSKKPSLGFISMIS